MTQKLALAPESAQPTPFRAVVVLGDILGTFLDLGTEEISLFFD